MSIFVGINEKFKQSVLSPNSNSGKENDSKSLQNNFLTMLVAQLKNQDPTNPMQNSQLTAQLAQLSSLTQSEKMNTTMSSILKQISSSQSLQSSMLVGHGVMIDGSQITVGKKSVTPFGFNLSGASDMNQITIKDIKGNVASTLGLGPLKAGFHRFTWDGKMQDGNLAPEGNYFFAVSSSMDKKNIASHPVSYSVVSGIRTENNNVLLDVGNQGFVKLSDVQEIG